MPGAIVQVTLDPAAGADICWFDLESGVEPASVLQGLGTKCAGLTEAMLEGLLRPAVADACDRSWNESGIRLVSTFAVYSQEERPDPSGGRSKATANFVYQPVDLLASDGWLLTCWHPRETDGQSTRVERAGEPGANSKVVDDASKRWRTRSGGKAGDLGVLVMQELALTYAPAHRLLYAELEEQEFNLYGRTSHEDEDARKPIQQVSDGLSKVWAAKAVLHDRLTPLNIPGLKDDYEGRAWLPITNSDEAERVDEMIDRSLKNLRKLSDSLRTSFHNLQLLNADAHRKHREHRQRHIEILAAVFLIPTLIVGFYGANTWIPGEQEEWGFIVMVACIAILTGLAALVIRKLQDADEVKVSTLLKNPFSTGAKSSEQPAHDDDQGSPIP